jgi:hypothetical protein
MTIEAEIDVRFVLHVSEQVDQEVVGGIQYMRDLPDCVFLPLVIRGSVFHQLDGRNRFHLQALPR